MEKIKNFVASTPIYIGYGLQMASEKFYDLAIKFHVVLGTETGKKIVAAQKAFLDLAKQMEAAEAQAQAHAQAQQGEESRLYSAIVAKQEVKDDELPEGVISLGKKRSESKD